MKHLRMKLVVVFRHWLWVIKHWRYLLVPAVLAMSGCGLVKYTSTLTLPDGEKLLLESNVPAVAEGKGYKIDQRSTSWWEKWLERRQIIEEQRK